MLPVVTSIKPKDEISPILVVAFVVALCGNVGATQPGAMSNDTKLTGQKMQIAIMFDGIGNSITNGRSPPWKQAKTSRCLRPLSLYTNIRPIYLELSCSGFPKVYIAFQSSRISNSSFY